MHVQSNTIQTSNLKKNSHINTDIILQIYFQHRQAKMSIGHKIQARTTGVYFSGGRRAQSGILYMQARPPEVSFAETRPGSARIHMIWSPVRVKI